MIALLLRIGLVTRRFNSETGAMDGTIRWPFHVAPWWIWKAVARHPWDIGVKMHGGLYVFRNLPGVIKWRKGRLLPIRWGFGILGLIEFGDRG